MLRAPLPDEAFAAILQELQRRPITHNAYRKQAGGGRSQAFGVVNRRCLPPDYSRQCWKRPLLYKLLLEFGAKYVDVSFNAITVNQNYQAAPHYDRGNVGDSFVVAFGDFDGGALKLHEGDVKGNYFIRNTPIVGDFSKMLHSVTPFVGNRYSLVFYQLRNTPPGLPAPDFVYQNNKWHFKRGDLIIPPSGGLTHPLRGRKKAGITKEHKTIQIDFS